ncbi:hypothetical protein JKA74_13385 [Marivirga sp. S37H4]|uniref:Uncharacterized protein n=1 Tax=Marivirga aurantiaca TaxID=2802615 RepID=A0A934X0B0_9BACT|nr:hypothetical protein [Marivirga aurantiaca]MBK6266030.1 hypothetical protein [Marivirga aurantiaca]
MKKSIKTLMIIALILASNSLYSQINSTCNSQSGDFTAQLYTLSGTKISTSQVQPNTEYDIRINYTGSWTYPTNAAYCVVVNVGFARKCIDAGNGNATIRIKTDPSLSYGFHGAIGPTNPDGNSASSCLSAWNPIE